MDIPSAAHRNRPATGRPLGRLVALGAGVLVGLSACGPESSGADGTPSMDDGPTPSIEGRIPPPPDAAVTVVALHRSDAATPAPPSDPVVMDQFAMAFAPTFLVVRAGQAVEFANSDMVDHNVLIVDPSTEESVFSEDTPPEARVRHVFDRPGLFDVFCDTHPAMAATILVVDAPWTVEAKPDGSFAFFDVPSGSYELRIWTREDGWRDGSKVTVAEGAPSDPVDLTSM